MITSEANLKANLSTPQTLNGSISVGQGKQGEQGLSAYQIWVSQGNVGKTIEDFFEYYRGYPGVMGLRGLTGPQGEQGIQGVKGDTGLTQEEKDYLFTSVANGKSSIASAISDKGVLTLADDSFLTMSNNIRNIVGSVPVNKDTWTLPTGWIDIRNGNTSNTLLTMLVDISKPITVRFMGYLDGSVIDMGDGNVITVNSSPYMLNYTYNQSSGTLLADGRRVAKITVKLATVNHYSNGIYLDGTNPTLSNVGIMWMHFPNQFGTLNANNNLKIYDYYYSSSYSTHRLQISRLDGYLKKVQLTSESGGTTLGYDSIYSYDDFTMDYNTALIGKCGYIGSANNVIYADINNPLFTSGNNSSSDGIFLKEIPKIKPISTVFPKFGYLQFVEKIPNIDVDDYGKTISLMNTFEYCYSLKDCSFMSNLNTSNNTTCSSTFYNCYSLKEAPMFDISNVSTIMNMFYGCRSLEKIPKYNYAKVTNFSNPFAGCKSLLEIDISTATSTLTGIPTFAYLNSLRSLILPPNWSYDLNVSYTDLSATELNRIFTNLPTVVGKTINITSTPGAATCTRTIATSKGWTITG